jgi:ATP:corrinoid adenosyltransferase
LKINNALLFSEDDKLGAVWHVVTEESNLQSFQQGCEWSKEKQTTEEIKEILLATDYMGRNLFYVATERYSVPLLDEICKCAKDNLTTGEVYNRILLATDDKGKTVWGWQQRGAI